MFGFEDDTGFQFRITGKPLGISILPIFRPQLIQRAGIEDILRHPEARQSVEEDIRRHLIKRFPVGIYYCIEGNSILIYAIMHMSRHPDYWKSRLD